MRRKRRPPAPAFRVPAPYNPMTGKHAPLGWLPDLTRVAMMQVLSVQDDYLICRGYDPEARLFLNLVAVGKPLLLQKTPWDGKTYSISGEDVTFTYEDDDTRTLDYSGGDTVRQTMSYPYFVGELLGTAKPVTTLGNTAGTLVGDNCVLTDATAQILYDSSGNPIAWLDLNVGGRGWVEGQASVWGKLDGALAYDETTGVTVSVWSADWSEDTGDDIENVLPPPTMEEGSIDISSWVRVTWRADGTPYVDMAPC